MLIRLWSFCQKQAEPVKGTSSPFSSAPPEPSVPATQWCCGDALAKLLLHSQQSLRGRSTGFAPSTEPRSSFHLPHQSSNRHQHLPAGGGGLTTNCTHHQHREGLVAPSPRDPGHAARLGGLQSKAELALGRCKTFSSPPQSSHRADTQQFIAAPRLTVFFFLLKDDQS